jgi:hypothetical protein
MALMVTMTSDGLEMAVSILSMPSHAVLTVVIASL